MYKRRTVARPTGGRAAPAAGVLCDYFLCEYLAGGAANADAEETADVTWIPKDSLTRFTPVDMVFPPILAVLEE